MSEYQYYNFRAIDRPLSSAEMKHLRNISSRAEITPVSFINEYNWGDLKANPRDLMRQFFDVHVYLANWGSAVLMLRLPRETLDEKIVNAFAVDGYFEAEIIAEYWLLTWSLGESDDYQDFEEEGSSWMARLAPLREELLRGDLRSLYIGWLQVVTADDTDLEMEPMVVDGLNDLTATQQALAEFLLVDPDILVAAGSGREARKEVEPTTLDAWLAKLPPEEVRGYLKQMLAGQGPQAERALKRSFAEWRSQASPGSRRTVVELRSLAEQAEKVRLAREREARRKAEADAKRKREATLNILARDFAGVWKRVHEEACRSCASAYDIVCRQLIDLRDAYNLQGDSETFRLEFQRFMAEHGRRKALVTRIDKAGLR
ncbi:MAG: hypothetical protein V2B20_01435 [Pseudomonadota bacterium]